MDVYNNNQPPQQEEEPQVTPEDNFLKELGNGVFVCAIGAKRSGKTYMLTKYLMYAIKNNMFEEYHLVLPQFKGNERSHAYDFLKTCKNVFVYNKYHEIIAKKILKLMYKKHIMFAVDDATGQFYNNIDPTLIELATCNEHQKACTIYICVHSAKKCLCPMIRQQCNFLILYRLSNRKLLYDIWEEFFSMDYYDFKEFYMLYREHVIENDDKNAIIYSLNRNNEMNGITDWNLLKEEPPEQRTGKAKLQDIDPKKEKIKYMFYMSQEKKMFKEQHEPQKKPKFISMFGKGK